MSQPIDQSHQFDRYLSYRSNGTTRYQAACTCKGWRSEPEDTRGGAFGKWIAHRTDALLWEEDALVGLKQALTGQEP